MGEQSSLRLTATRVCRDKSCTSQFLSHENEIENAEEVPAVGAQESGRLCCGPLCPSRELCAPRCLCSLSLRPSKKGPQLLHFKTQGELNAPPRQEESFRSVIGMLPARCSSLRPCLDVLPPLDRRCFPSQLGKIHSFTPHGGGGSSGISSGGGEAAAVGGVSDGPTFSAAWCSHPFLGVFLVLLVLLCGS